MAEMAIAVDPSASIASSSALLPVPKPLLIITMINGNGRIIPAPAFVPKGLPAAIAAKPIPRKDTGSMETRPGIWINAEKARDLADHMEVTLTILTLKCLETHVTDVILLPQDHSLKWRTPSPDFIFTEDDFSYLPGSETPSKRQFINDGTISLGSLMPPLHFASDYDPDYFASVPVFLDHEPDADYIEQSLIWCRPKLMPAFFGLHKNIFYHSVPVGLYGLVASACPMGVQYNFIDKCSCSRCK